MKTLMVSLALLAFTIGNCCAQEKGLNRLNILIGNWTGTGQGFGNNESKIESSFKWSMNKKYIEVMNDSKFAPTAKNPDGEHHIDKGFISFDKTRGKIIFRQFNIEGYVNQYVLNDSLSTDTKFIFETETIENFIPGGKAKWSIDLKDSNTYESTFEVSFPNKDYTCFGRNKQVRTK